MRKHCSRHLAKLSPGRANDLSPGPFRDLTPPPQPRWFRTHGANVSSSSRREWIQHLAPATKFLRNCCPCRATQFLRNLRAAMPMGSSPGPFRDHAETAPNPPPYRRDKRGGFALSEEPNSCTGPTLSASCYPPSRREWMQHLAKVQRLPQNFDLTLRKCGAGVPMGPSPGPFRDRANVFSILLPPSSPDFSIFIVFPPFFFAHPCILKISICQATYLSKLSICHANHIGKRCMCQAICHGYRVKATSSIWFQYYGSFLFNFRWF